MSLPDLWRLTQNVTVDQLGHHSGEEVHQVDIFTAGAVRADLVDRGYHETFTLMQARVVRGVVGTGLLDTLSQQVLPRPRHRVHLNGSSGWRAPGRVSRRKWRQVPFPSSSSRRMLRSSSSPLSSSPSSLKASCRRALQ